MWFDRLANTAWAALPVVLVVLALRPGSSRELRRFVNRYRLRYSSETEPTMIQLMVRSRASRFLGAAMGLSVVPVCLAFGVAITTSSIVFGVGGYLVGAFAAALVPIQPTTGKRQALLVPRRTGDYLPRFARLTPAVGVAIALVASVIYVLEPRRRMPTFFSSNFGLAEAVIAAVATVIAVHVIVARPQPLGTPDLVAIDDALRTQAVHVLAGAGIAVSLGGAAACLFNMGGYATNGWIHIAGLISGTLALGLALAAWLFCTAPWRVSRPLPP